MTANQQIYLQLDWEPSVIHARQSQVQVLKKGGEKDGEQIQEKLYKQIILGKLMPTTV